MALTREIERQRSCGHFFETIHAFAALSFGVQAWSLVSVMSGISRTWPRKRSERIVKKGAAGDNDARPVSMGDAPCPSYSGIILPGPNLPPNSIVGRSARSLACCCASSWFLIRRSRAKLTFFTCCSVAITSSSLASAAVSST